jgi:phosphohistidine swiveling domain-containing protein
MQYIYNEQMKKSATTIAGQAYHEALDKYFTAKQENKVLSLAELEVIAFAHIDEIPGNSWKLQKTAATVEDCHAKATATVTKLLHNFYKEKSLYEDEVAEIISTEITIDEYITVNGVDIPIPCTVKIDLVLRMKDGKIVIVDHKSKDKFTDVEVLKLTSGIQAITYVSVFEEFTGTKVDEVWFVENKYTENKDKSAQLSPFILQVDDDFKKLYEALLYEPLRRMIEAVSNPDYLYLINDSDTLVDRVEIYNFWLKTMIAEVDDFDIDPSKRELIQKRLKKVRDSSVASASPKTLKKFKTEVSQFIKYDLSNMDLTPQEKIEHVLRKFGAIVKVEHEFIGWSSNTYLMDVSAGVQVASVKKHGLDLANALNVSNVRFSNNLVVHEGTSYLSIDFSKKREKDLLFEPSDLVGYAIPIGRDNFGNVIVWDYANNSTPHALVCGATGSGKSVCINSTAHYSVLAGIEDILIFDPKFEFTGLHGLNGIRVINEIEDIELEMAILVEEMNRRVKDKISKLKVVIVDEFADAVAQSRKGRELGKDKSLEENLRILVQKGRSLGYRVLAATQRASTKVITGDAKANFPVQICFRVPKIIDSKVVLDEPGAECLAGHGDGLIKSPQYPDIVRFQGYYKS